MHLILKDIHSEFDKQIMDIYCQDQYSIRDYGTRYLSHPQSVFWGIECEQRVGFIVFDVFNHTKSVVIFCMVVSPKFRGMGLGSKMMRQFIRFVKRTQPNILFIRLSCIPRAKSFYLRLGFQEQPMPYDMLFSLASLKRK